ncbi:uncharacterized protein LOC126054491 [Helicoverpa armigera]|uniref:uncharacterized protein LOC126054491 n=1 Tax=Helicoverpa armigera TaxID=29058 RepID=UPI0021118993|nr:uncharacterized protein LOC126054491 [Helicoverpa armigera]XP_049696270.1 uncharacterized protein LOC126054491 [Helicoverpa armigera]XP_049696271.1 uncharacterized protein LOC126054491 [Helicoverpa armigera]
MKSYILVALLAALASCLDAAVLPTPINAPTVAGEVQPGDWVLLRGWIRTAPSTSNQALDRRLRYTLSERYQVNAVSIVEVGPPQGGAPAFVGGLGTNVIDVVLVAARGRGFEYNIELWGHDTTGAYPGPNPPDVLITEL